MRRRQKPPKRLGLMIERTGSKHGRLGPFRKPGGSDDEWERESWQTTKSPPWRRKASRRAAARRARQARKANR